MNKRKIWRTSYTERDSLGSDQMVQDSSKEAKVSSARFQRVGPAYLPHPRPVHQGNQRPRGWWVALQAEAGQPSLCISVVRANVHWCQAQLLPGLSLAGPLEVSRARWCQAGGGLCGFAKRKPGLADPTKGLSGPTPSSGWHGGSPPRQSVPPFPRRMLRVPLSAFCFVFK